MAENKTNKISVLKIILIWIVSVPIILLGYPTLALLGIGLMPTIITWMTESEAGKPRTLSIGAFNLCGVVPYVFELWEKQQSFQFVLHTLKDPNAWMIMYGTCTVGWAIYLGVPKIVLGAMRVRAILRIKELRTYQEAIVEEWGDEVRPEKRHKKEEGA